MKYNIPIKKLDNGFSIPEFGFGTYLMGGRRERDPGNDDEGDIKAIRTAIDLGVTHIDTAEIYAIGKSEELVGQAIKPYNRDELFIASKVSPWHFKRDDLIRSCESSLKRLEIDSLDLYQLHQYSDEVPLKKTMKTLDELLERGLIKNIGVSNFGFKHLKEAQSYSSNKIVSNQVHYNLSVREPEIEGLLEYCQSNDVMLIAWRPVSIGMRGDYNLEETPEILQELATKYDKTPIQIALNWLVSQKNVVTLVKTKSIDHMKENLGSVGWYLSEEDIERLRQEFPNQKKLSEVINLSK